MRGVTLAAVFALSCASPSVVAPKPAPEPPVVKSALIQAPPLTGPFAEAEVLEAVAVAALPADPWTLPAKTFPVVAQRTVKLNDRDANAQLGKRAEVTVRAAYTSSELGVYVEWADPTETRFDPAETNSYGDSVAIELPQRFGEGVRLPHIGMGDAEQLVDVYMARAALSGVLENRYVAAGFGSLTRAPALTAKMTLAHADGWWRASFVRPLVDGPSALTQGLVPIAVALWDGARAERGDYKSLTSWKLLRLGQWPASAKYLEELSWGFAAAGDPAKGKQQFSTICLACHRTPDYPFAMEGMAPDLTDVGAIALPVYLRESIRHPSAVVVHHLNPNRQYDRSKPPDKNGAYPNNPAMEWFTVGADGKKVSKMPELTNLTDDDVVNLVAYLRTLDGTR